MLMPLLSIPLTFLLIPNARMTDALIDASGEPPSAPIPTMALQEPGALTDTADAGQPKNLSTNT